MRLQSVIRAIYPAQCVACDAQTEAENGLCGSCWRETSFISGLACDSCGAPLPGEDSDDAVQCDDCMKTARPWDHGRAAIVYTGIGRRLVMGLKHGDRLDLVGPAAQWMARRMAPLICADSLFVPVPLHWTRLFKRRYNQAAVLAQEMGKITGKPTCVDALIRPHRTKPLEGHGRNARFEALAGAIVANPNRTDILANHRIILVDDVMTSGATLAAATEACKSAGAENVSIVTLARVVKDT